MGFYQKSTDFDLGELNIENLFISDFMPAASGTNVKVYLMGLMLTHSEREMDNRALAATLKLPVQDVAEAWAYWESQGLIERQFHENGDPLSFDVIFYSVRALYIQNNYASKHRTRQSTSTFDARNDAFKHLIQSVQQITGPMTYAERRELGNFTDYYYADETILLKAFEYAYKTQNRRHFKAVKALLQSWIDRGCTTLDAINRLIAADAAREGVYREVLGLLGVPKLANAGQKELIDKWLDVYGFEPSALYPILTDISKKTLSVNFNYLDKHFETLHQEGIHSYEAFSNRTAAAPSSASQPTKTTRRKQYTIEKDRVYSDEELEALLLNKGKES